MVKQLKRFGNSVGIIIDRPILDAVKLDESSEVEISTNGECILISPVRDKKRVAKFKAAYDEVKAAYAGAFARLAK